MSEETTAAQTITERVSKKRKAKDQGERPEKKPRIPLEGIFLQLINFPPDFMDEMEDNIDDENKKRASSGLKPLQMKLYESSRIRLTSSPEEIAQKRKKYRAMYRNKPENVQKRIEKSKDPEIIKKRKEYASREEVKNQKKILSQRRRKILRTIKEIDPEKYKEALQKVMETVQ
jgi:hypothetical protein